MQTLETQHLNSEIDNGSILGSQSTLKPKGFKVEKPMATVLNLTSLIDAFTILVSYLLMAASIGLETIDMPKDMQLPNAAKSDVLERGIVIRITDNQYFIDDKPVAMDQMGPQLAELKKSVGADKPVIIQADRRTNFMQINPIVLSGLQAGFAQIRFAVKQEDSN